MKEIPSVQTLESESKKCNDIDCTVKVLDDFNRWRRGADIVPPRPVEIGRAIDRAILELNKIKI